MKNLLLLEQLLTFYYEAFIEQNSTTQFLMLQNI